MPHLHAGVVVTLGVVACIAAALDALVGGGGLVNLPALLLAGLPPHIALGTNKLAGIAGTTSATLTYAAAKTIRWPIVYSAAVSAFFGGIAGARMVIRIHPDMLRIIVSALLIIVSIIISLRPTLGTAPPRTAPERSLWRSAIIGLLLGCYDGFFGPGAGLFLIFLFIMWLGLDFLAATGAAKVVNLASNAAAVVVFAASQAIDYQVGVIMAAGAVVGGYAGSRLAVLRGAAFIRYVFLVVVWILSARLLWQLIEH